jgi:CRISPR-associated protein Cas1
MIGRIVEVADDKRHLFLHRGFMVVQDTVGERKELGQVPLDDIAAVIANAHGLSYTNNLLVALAERGAPFVLVRRQPQRSRHVAGPSKGISSSRDVSKPR